jgi:hypothetical protein
MPLRARLFGQARTVLAGGRVVVQSLDFVSMFPESWLVRDVLVR